MGKGGKREKIKAVSSQNDRIQGERTGREIKDTKRNKKHYILCVGRYIHELACSMNIMIRMQQTHTLTHRNNKTPNGASDDVHFVFLFACFVAIILFLCTETKDSRHRGRETTVHNITQLCFVTYKYRRCGGNQNNNKCTT